MRDLNMVLGIKRERDPLFCDLIGLQYIYVGHPKKQAKIFILEFFDSAKDKMKSGCAFYRYAGENVIEERRHTTYGSLLKALRYEPKRKAAKKKKSKKKAASKRW